MNSRLLAFLVACGFVLASCGQPPEVVTEIEEAPTVVPEIPDRGRDWRRMDLDQLKVSIERVTGGVGWTGAEGRELVNLFDELALTLGKPDYVDTTYEDLDPSLLFQKFLADAANAICEEFIRVESTSDPDNRLLAYQLEWTDTWEVAPDKVRIALARAILRFHGREVAAEEAEIDEWAWLLRSVTHVTDGTTQDAWNAVCVALITHPDFYMY
jgi:hypothetical protein